jgi:hypothetical protein
VTIHTVAGQYRGHNLQTADRYSHAYTGSNPMRLPEIMGRQ